MAIPKPDIETTRSGRAQQATALPAILTATTVDRRPGRFNLREHVKSHHNYFEEDTSDASDEELMEHDGEADDVCHTACEVRYNHCPRSF